MTTIRQFRSQARSALDEGAKAAAKDTYQKAVQRFRSQTRGLDESAKASVVANYQKRWPTSAGAERKTDRDADLPPGSEALPSAHDVYAARRRKAAARS